MSSLFTSAAGVATGYDNNDVGLTSLCSCQILAVSKVGYIIILPECSEGAPTVNRKGVAVAVAVVVVVVVVVMELRSRC